MIDKKLCSLLVIIVATLILTGCSQKDTPTLSTQTSTQPTPTSVLTQSTPSPLVKFALENNISENLVHKLENYLGENLSENVVKFIEILSKFNSDYIPKNISDIVPKNYKSELSERLQEDIINYIASDGNISEDEIKALEFILALPKDVQKWYIEEVGLDKETINYLNLLNGIEDEDSKLYAAESVLCYADRQIDDIEKEFLKNLNKNLDIIKKYYSSKLEKIPNLREQVEELPEYKENSVKTIEALEDIAALAQNAEPYEKFEDRFNLDKITPAREVYEAFELMLSGGKPDPEDFGYSVPSYNTELQCLWWLAENNEFKNYDTLAQAIAMDNGIFITVGTEEVKKAVKEDMNEYLKFGRETSEWQKALNLSYNLEEYPLEAKLFWADRAGTSLIGGSYDLYGPDKLRGKSEDFRKEKLPLKGYEWDIVSLETLKEMRKEFLNDFMDYKGDIISFAGFLDNYFRYSSTNSTSHWIYTSGKNKEKYLKNPVDMEGRNTILINYGNVDWNWKHYQETGKGIGVCLENAELISNILKSYGISSAEVQLVKYENGRLAHVEFVAFTGEDFDNPYNLFSKNRWETYGIFLPPIDQRSYFKFTCDITGKGYYDSDKTCAISRKFYHSAYTPPDIDRIDMKKMIYRTNN